MIEYHKIKSVFKRDEKTHKFIEGEWSLPEFEYLKNNSWVFTEKVDGMNIRIDWELDCVTGKPENIRVGGRTKNSIIPGFLYDRLNVLFTKEKFKEFYPGISMTLYGEGYGAKIQKGGGNYKNDGTDFVLFDVLVNGLWLERDNVEDIASKLNIRIVPIVGSGTLNDAIDVIKSGLQSRWGNFFAEGLVLRPTVELQTRRGNRIITKVKYKDFKREERNQ